MKNRPIKIVFGIAGTIILGAIGSGLWERILSGFFDAFVGYSIDLIDMVFTSYKDDIYANAANGLHESHSLALYCLYLAMLPLAYLWVLRKHPTQKDKREKSKKSNFTTFLQSSKGYWFIYGLTLIVIAFSFFMTAKLKYTNTVATYSLRSLAIVQPYITDNEYKILKSKFYQVERTEDFMHFYNTINEIGVKQSIKLPKFNVL